jgi:hypothetical protein
VTLTLSTFHYLGAEKTLRPNLATRIFGGANYRGSSIDCIGNQSETKHLYVFTCWVELLSICNSLSIKSKASAPENVKPMTYVSEPVQSSSHLQNKFP